MKVKVKKIKNIPTPVREQEYTCIKNGKENRISEQRFAEIIKGIYNIVFYPAVPGAKKRMFPDLKISEYAERFNL